MSPEMIVIKLYFYLFLILFALNIFLFYGLLLNSFFRIQYFKVIPHLFQIYVLNILTFFNLDVNFIPDNCVWLIMRVRVCIHI